MNLLMKRLVPLDESSIVEFLLFQGILAIVSQPYYHGESEEDSLIPNACRNNNYRVCDMLMRAGVPQPIPFFS